MKKIIAIAGFFGIFASLVTNASAGYFNTDPIDRCETQITQTLQMGSQSGEVGLLQELLINSGFLHTTPNGYYGEQTRAAVRSFQANNGIRITGTVGEATRNALNERMCDSDLLDNTFYFNDGYDNGYNNTYTDGVTYVTNDDPFVRVISPAATTPVIYNAPKNNSSTHTRGSTQKGYFSNSVVYNEGPFSPNGPRYPGTLETGPILPNNQYQSNSQISSTNIVYNPSIGYTYGITAPTGSITVGSPVANTVYKEGDIVKVSWSTKGTSSSHATIIFENKNSSQSRIVGTTGGNSYSFVLTKELLDAVCSSECNDSQQGSFKLVISLPTTDIAGIKSTIKAVIEPIAVSLQTSISQQVTVASNRNPVNVNEMFRLYVNIPSFSYSTAANQNYSLRVRAVCPTSVSVSIAGVPCGQDFLMPISFSYAQQEVPVMVTSNIWFKQDVGFAVAVINQLGQIIGTAKTSVSINAAPINW